MLTQLRAYSQWSSAPTLILNQEGNAETDLIQIRNIDGLDPVKASITTSPYGDLDGVSFGGAKVDSRNIVLTLGTNPDWNTHTHASLRNLVLKYFIPKARTRLVFYSDDLVPVEISGYVESVTNNMFSKDPEVQVSIICPYPYFQAQDPTVVTGETGFTPMTYVYNGTVETGINVKITKNPGSTEPTYISIQEGPEGILKSSVSVASVLPATSLLADDMYFEMNSYPLHKYVKNIYTYLGEISYEVNILKGLYFEDRPWTILRPGDNYLTFYTDEGTHSWEMTYFELFGGL